MSDYDKLKEELDYLSEHAVGFECIDEKKKNLAIVRLACMQRNKVYQADCEKLRKLKKTGHPDLKTKEEEFFAKWDIDRQGISLKREKSVQIMNVDNMEYMTLKIDLLQPKSRLLKRIEALIEKRQQAHEEITQENDYELQPKEIMTQEEFYAQLEGEMVDIKTRMAVAKESRQIQSIEYYRQALMVWDLRNGSFESKKSWGQIKKILAAKGEHLSDKGIRNRYYAMEKIIQEGVPFFKEFPTR